MVPQVRVSKRDLAAFRRRVAYHYKQHPMVEYMEGLVIRQDGNQYEIIGFERLWIEKRSRWRINNNDLQFEAIRNEAAKKGLRVGTIHTHTMSDSAPSFGDIESGLDDREALMGICEVDCLKSGRLKMHIDFWVPRPPCIINQICD